MLLLELFSPAACSTAARFSTASSTTANSSSFSPSARLAGCVRLDARNTHARARHTTQRLARFQTRTRFADGKSMARPFQPRYASRTVCFFFFFFLLSFSLSLSRHIFRRLFRDPFPFVASLLSPFDHFPFIPRTRPYVRVRLSLYLTSNFTRPFAHQCQSFFSSISSSRRCFTSTPIPRV